MSLTPDIPTEDEAIFALIYHETETSDQQERGVLYFMERLQIIRNVIDQRIFRNAVDKSQPERYGIGMVTPDSLVLKIDEDDPIILNIDTYIEHVRALIEDAETWEEFKHHRENLGRLKRLRKTVLSKEIVISYRPAERPEDSDGDH